MILDNFRLDGRSRVVTGAGQGIGRGIAIGFAEAGADVVVGARTQADLDEVVARVEETGRRALAVVTDVMEAEDRERLVAAAVDGSAGSTYWSTTPAAPARAPRCRPPSGSSRPR